jgi:LmbE family N-acetylglucosaminyl deacetylase
MDAVIHEQNPIQGQGTSADAWKTSCALAATPWIEPAQLRRTFERLIVVAPHPDDEILIGSGLLSTLVDQEQHLRIIAVTDGEASHPNSPEWPPQALRMQRPMESRAALDRLGLRSDRVIWHRLGLPDSAVATRTDRLLDCLRNTLRPGDTVLTTWRHDGHCDHDAVGQACARITAEKDVPLIEVPVWAWHWAQPDDHRMPWSRAHRLALSPACLARKKAAIAAHATQLTAQGSHPAVLTQATLQRLLQPFELVFL